MKIMLLSEDMPSKKQLMNAVSRLMKDYEMLSKCRGKKDAEDPQAIIATASFLDMLVRRESRTLEKGDLVADRFVSSIKDKFMTHLLSMTQEEAIDMLVSIQTEFKSRVVNENSFDK